MRLISQNGTIDVPYEMSAIRNDDGLIILCMAGETGKGSVIATYSTSEKAEKAMEMLRTAYTGRFVTNANVPDDFNEQLRELMKGGFGTVIVKDTHDCRVEFNNLNGYFQFPADEDVEEQPMERLTNRDKEIAESEVNL